METRSHRESFYCDGLYQFKRQMFKQCCHSDSNYFHRKTSKLKSAETLLPDGQQDLYKIFTVLLTDSLKVKGRDSLQYAMSSNCGKSERTQAQKPNSGSRKTHNGLCQAYFHDHIGSDSSSRLIDSMIGKLFLAWAEKKAGPSETVIEKDEIFSVQDGFEVICVVIHYFNTPTVQSFSPEIYCDPVVAIGMHML